MINIPFNLNANLDCRLFRELLFKTGYRDTTLRKYARMDPTLREIQMARQTPLNILTRLFLFGETVSESDLSRTLPPELLDGLVAANIVQSDAAGIHAVARLAEYKGHLIMSDFKERNIGATQVMEVDGSSISLAKLTPRISLGTILDVGTGTGIHALLASRHSEKVIATDVSERALNFAAMNARLNGISNIEFRKADLFDFIHKEQFDMIVSNPPFVVSPEQRYLFRDSGLSADGMSEQLLRGAPEHLKVGGYAIIHVSWYYRSEADWAERPLKWVTGSGFDVWWIRHSRHDPLDYTSFWLGKGASSHEYAEWLDFYRSLEAGGLSVGTVILRKHSRNDSWQRFDDFGDLKSSRALNDTAGQIETIFAAEECLQKTDGDDKFFDYTFYLHPAHNVIQEQNYSGEYWKVTKTRLSSTRGFPFTTHLDTFYFDVLKKFDGTRSLRNAIGSVASLMDVDFDTVAPNCLEMTKQLFRDGLLTIRTPIVRPTFND